MTPIVVTLDEVRQQKQVWIGVSLPYELRHCAAASYARWSKRLRKWLLPRSVTALRAFQRAVAAAAEGPLEFRMDGQIESFGRRAETVDDVERGLRNDRLPVLDPWDHQVLGSDMVGQMGGCLLAWDMGSGKTKTIFDAILRYGMRNVLVMCPSSVVRVWSLQSELHLPEGHDMRDVLALDSRRSVARRAEALCKRHARAKRTGESVLCVVNYEAAWRGALGDELLAWPGGWDLVVCDESHRIANSKSRQSKFCAQVGSAADHRVAMTGTPMSNGPIDIFGQMQFVDPGLFGTNRSRFEGTYCIKGGFEGRQIVGYQNLEGFNERLARVSTKIDLDEVVELPESVDRVRSVELSKDTRSVYDRLKRDFVADIGEHGTIEASSGVVKTLRLQQLTSGHAVVEDLDTSEKTIVEYGGEKRADLREFMLDLPDDEPIVVFAKFTHDVQSARRVAEDLERPHFEISGAEKSIEGWERECDEGRGAVIAVQIQAGGLGIDLTRARYVYYYSIGASYADYAQSRARVRRPGQRFQVSNYHAIARATVDVPAYRAMGRKANIADAVISHLRSAASEAVT